MSHCLTKKRYMNNIKAIGFDLFNTLITVEPHALSLAMDRLILSLRQSGFPIQEEPFKTSYQVMAARFIQRSRQEGKETHNRFWISAALEEAGEIVSPEDLRIAEAVEHYFSVFYDYCRPIPGTEELLSSLRERYPLGLLSNFTHGPAAREILGCTGLESYFDTILISGELGFRKPFPLVFDTLSKRLGVAKDSLIYIGDDPDSDIYGAAMAGLQPIWSTYAMDNNLPLVWAGTDPPGTEIPRISSWQDLLSLLDHEMKPAISCEVPS
jgi:putative hydrolase of the HAD superfamily